MPPEVKPEVILQHRETIKLDLIDWSVKALNGKGFRYEVLLV